jgi:Ca2+-binding RTX toxin-like protein
VNVGSNGDILRGGLGDDRLYGLAGDDRLYGGRGGDHLGGGSGFDTANYADSPARVKVNLASTGAQSGGDAQGDTLGSIQGIVGSEFADALFGTHGENRLRGLGGDDLLTGRKGRDVLYGDAGADRFDFNSIAESKVGANRDVIKDFHRSQGDQIDLSTIDANTQRSGAQAFTFIGAQGFHDRPGELHVIRVSGQNRVEGDVNGDGSADFQITVLGGSLERGDFLL